MIDHNNNNNNNDDNNKYNYSYTNDNNNNDNNNTYYYYYNYTNSNNNNSAVEFVQIFKKLHLLFDVMVCEEPLPSVVQSHRLLQPFGFCDIIKLIYSFSHGHVIHNMLHMCVRSGLYVFSRL